VLTPDFRNDRQISICLSYEDGAACLSKQQTVCARAGANRITLNNARAKTLLADLFLTVVVAVQASSQTMSANPEAGSEACSTCHSQIYSSYSKTVMANASGLAGDGLITGEFKHKKSGVFYRVYQQNDRAWISYEREKESEFRGQRELLYFIGSGVKGRSYLFSVQGFLFETPINWYAQEHRWNMTPAYTEAREIPMNLPSYVDCLNCHSSGLQPPIEGTDSKFPGKPFLHAGITCERCHGVGEGHLQGNGPIVNPAKLAVERRDAICLECHFEGTVAVEQPGKRLYQFQPGDRLSDYIHYFLLTGTPPQKVQALSQVEALSLSACKRKAGDRMWCVSCHDPHKEPGVAEKVGYYRAKCLNCHGEAFGAKHHPDKPDCTQCHMPGLPNAAVAHTQSTDHRILRYPNGFQLPSPVAEPNVVSFPASALPQSTTRDFALVWASLAQRGIEGASRHAEQYLRMAVKERPDDPKLLSALGFIDQQGGREKEARELYERALKLDPLSSEAATNLGTLEARTGNLRRAVELWQRAFDRVPYRSAIGMDLAMAFCAAGQKEEARRYVLRVLDFNPDFTNAKRLLAHLNADPVRCKP
jgi:tetratricopeptide (TPR) repeat protein